MTDQPACSSCQAPITFVLVANNAGHKPRHMPLNPHPDPAGNIAVHRDTTGRRVGRVLSGDQKPAPFETVYGPHFATCTRPHAHRRRKPARPPATAGPDLAEKFAGTPGQQALDLASDDPDTLIPPGGQ